MDVDVVQTMFENLTDSVEAGVLFSLTISGPIHHPTTIFRFSKL